MFGQVTFLLASPRKVVTVPAAAVLHDGAERFVLVEEGPGQYVRQNVVTGRQARGLVEVRDGQVVPGDRVVTVGGHELAALFGRDVLRLSPQAARNIGLRVEPARRRPVAEVLQLSGAVELPPQRRALAFARLPGTIRQILVDRDQTVRAGDVLAEAISPDFQDLQLALLRSHLQSELLGRRLQKVRAVIGALPERTLRETESDYRAAQLRRDSYWRKLEAVGLTREEIREVLDRRRPVETLPVRAPIGGAVVGLQATLGHLVEANHPVFEIHDLGRRLVRGYVSERQLAAVRVGQTARVRLLADPAEEATGIVIRSGQTVGADDRSLSVWVELGEELQPASRLLPALGAGDPLTLAAWAHLPGPPPRWLPGMLTRLTLVVSEPGPTLAVPRGAVLREGTRAFLFLRRADSTFERRPVVIGRGDDRFVAVTAGLEEGEEVAVSGVAGLQTAYATIR
jgi:multidrug efflux pump subunit AcrA (membrane-fusion protein)